MEALCDMIELSGYIRGMKDAVQTIQAARKGGLTLEELVWMLTRHSCGAVEKLSEIRGSAEL